MRERIMEARLIEIAHTGMYVLIILYITLSGLRSAKSH